MKQNRSCSIFTNHIEVFMKTYTKNPTTVAIRWTRLLGSMLMVAFMVSAVAFSQPTAPVLATPGNNATDQPQAPT